MLIKQRQAVRRNVRVPVVYIGSGESPPVVCACVCVRVRVCDACDSSVDTLGTVKKKGREIH